MSLSIAFVSIWRTSEWTPMIWTTTAIVPEKALLIVSHRENKQFASGKSQSGWRASEKAKNVLIWKYSVSKKNGSLYFFTNYWISLACINIVPKAIFRCSWDFCKSGQGISQKRTLTPGSWAATQQGTKPWQPFGHCQELLSVTSTDWKGGWSHPDTHLRSVSPSLCLFSFSVLSLKYLCC